jgi:Uma2 family endonuclease
LADWEALPADGNRYEVVEGVLYVVTAPSSFHQWIVQNLIGLVGLPAVRQGLAYAFPAPVGVIMPGCDPVQPDYVVVLRSRADMIHDRRIWGVPDLIFEVLSPGSAAYDEHVKLAAYQRAGVPEYAVVDPAKREIRHYRLDATGHYRAPEARGETQVISFDCLPQLPVQVSDLFSGAPDVEL